MTLSGCGFAVRFKKSTNNYLWVMRGLACWSWRSREGEQGRGETGERGTVRESMESNLPTRKRKERTSREEVKARPRILKKRIEASEWNGRNGSQRNSFGLQLVSVEFRRSDRPPHAHPFKVF